MNLLGRLMFPLGVFILTLAAGYLNAQGTSLGSPLLIGFVWFGYLTIAIIVIDILSMVLNSAFRK